MKKAFVFLACTLILGISLSYGQPNGVGPGNGNGNGNGNPVANGVANGIGQAVVEITGSDPVLPTVPLIPLESSAEEPALPISATGVFVEFVHDDGDLVAFPSIVLDLDLSDDGVDEVSFKAAPYQFLDQLLSVSTWESDVTILTVTYVVNAKNENVILSISVDGADPVSIRDDSGHPSWNLRASHEPGSGQFPLLIDASTVQLVSGVVTSVSKGFSSGKVRLHLNLVDGKILVTVGGGLMLTLQGMEIHRGDPITSVIARRIRTHEWVMLQIQNPETGEMVQIRNRFGYQLRLVGQVQ